MKTIALLAMLLVVPASATVVFFGGTFDPGGSLSDGSFAGYFELSFPIGTTNGSLDFYDVYLTEGSTTYEIPDGMGTLGLVLAGNEGQNGALEIEFNDVNGNYLNLYFAIPFTGDAPILVATPRNLTSAGELNDGSGPSVVNSGFTSLTMPVPEPATWWLTGAGGLLLLLGAMRAARRNRALADNWTSAAQFSRGRFRCVR